MWIWIWELKQMGFRQKSERYFQCARGFGLEQGQHLSLFLWTRNAKKNATCFAVTEFHVTIQLGGDHLHFYYHELAQNVWRRGGHTSTIEIERLGYCAQTLRSHAEFVANQFIEQLNGEWMGD